MTSETEIASDEAIRREASVSTPAPTPYLRPRDAAALILIDRSKGHSTVLLGRRANRHTFMPGTYVFPGGRRDRADGRHSVARDLDAAVVGKLRQRVGGSTSAVRPRALAVAAVRETFEETGLSSEGVASGIGEPDLSKLRFVARAITPPGRPRRYDTRFFAGFTDELELDPGAIADSDELLDLRWVRPSETGALPLPRITRTVLAHLQAELAAHPNLPLGRPVPFYYFRGTRQVEDIL